jgi:hypothetical protein
MGIRSLVAACLCWFAMAAGQASDAAKPYDVEDAYQIYSVLLPQEEAYGFAKDTLMIGEEAVSASGIPRECLTLEAANKFKDAIADFTRLQSKKWLLQPRFQIEKSYRLVGPGTISALPPSPPNPRSSAAYVKMSAVGFSREKTRAIVYMESACGGLCGSGRYHLLEKVHDRWKEVRGVTCAMAS